MMLGGNPASSGVTNLLYAGEQFDTHLQQYYLRARYYDQNIGRFTSVDPFAGSTQDPQSLHKYLYCHANPVNGVDPSGMYDGICGLMVSFAINSIISSISSSIFQPILENITTDLLPDWVWKVLDVCTPNAMLIGLGGAVTGGYVIGGGITGSIEALWSPFTSKGAIYGLWGGTVGLMSGKGIGANAQVYSGLVYNTKDSDIYTGLAVSVTIPLRKLTDKLQRKIMGDTYKLLSQLVLPPAFPSDLRPLRNLNYHEELLKTANAIGSKAGAFLEISIGNTGSVVVALGASANIGKSTGASISFISCKQLWPEGVVRF